MASEKIWAIKDGYLVNRDGSIYKLDWKNTGKMHKVKQHKNPNGYFQFSCNGKTTLSHRFIAKCFVANPNNLLYVNHKDENKTNNCVDNLEWCTGKYNTNYGKRNKIISKKLKGNSNKSKKVLQYKKDGEFVKEWVSASEIERQLGYNRGNISSCCKGKLKTAYDFVWKHHQSIKS